VVQIDGLDQVLWPDHCVENTPGAELAAALHTSSVAFVFRKGTDRRVDSYSGFFDNGRRGDTGLADYLRRSRVTDVYVAGLATDYCVRATALDAAELGFRTHVVEDACRGVDLREGDVRRALQEMARAGVERVNGREWLAARRDSPTVETIAEGRYLRLVSREGWQYAQRINATAVVGVVAITADGELVLVEQFRIPIGRRTIELPAGLVGDSHDELDELAETAARRELIEETGLAAGDLWRLTESAPSAGLTSETMTFFLATDVRQAGVGGGVDGELILVHRVAWRDAPAWLARRTAEGLMVAATVYAGLWLAERSPHFSVAREQP
jgi:8-oxo-dGTP pyrophosphatase MutT (NUDIX family)